jgi:hypothetical protein
MTEPVDLVWMGEEPETKYEAGWAFFVDTDWRRGSCEMRADLTRRPIVVCLPSNSGPVIAFAIDSYATDSRELWTVTVVEDSLIVGQKPDITVSPSIDVEGSITGS